MIEQPTPEDWCEHGDLLALIVQARTGYVIDRIPARERLKEPARRRAAALEAAAHQMPAVSGPGLGIAVRRRDALKVIQEFERSNRPEG